MKKSLSVLLFAAGAFIITLNSCKKKEEDATKPTLDAQTTQHNTDANTYKDESDALNNDINAALDSTSLSTGRLAGNGNPFVNLCADWQMDTSNIASKKVSFHFTGAGCNGRTRTGDIAVELTGGAKWADVGSVLTITYTNFKIANAAGQWIKFNGTKTLKNLNGNDWWGFITNTATLKYQERAFNIGVDFSDGNHATWNSARTVEYSYTILTNNITLIAKGDTSFGGYTNVDSWGSNRFSKSFTTYYISPLVTTSNCLWRPNSGQLVHNVNNTDFTLTLGTDANGNPSSGNCPGNFKVVWKGLDGNTNSYVFSYWW